MQQELVESEKPKIPFYKSVLKSAVQKAIRRGEVDKAVRCCKSFLELDEMDCLRRSMIWPIEDVILHPGYDELAKLIAKLSVKGSVPLTEAEKTKVLTIVADFASCEYRDLDVGNPDDGGKDYAMRMVKGSRENDLVNAILYRSKIGGTKWDYWMLNQMARVWNKRFAEGSWTAEKLKQYFVGEVYEWDDVAYATAKDILPASIDMHTDPWIMGKILQKPGVKEMINRLIPKNERNWSGWRQAPENDEGIIEQVMWCLRSSVNLKKNVWSDPPAPITYLQADNVPEELWPKYQEIFEKIKPDLDGIAKWKLGKQLERK